MEDLRWVSSCPIVVKYSSFSLGAVNEAEVLDAVESTLVIVFLMLSILSVKNLSTAFDLVDHNILLSCLESCLGLRGMVLQWFRSYLSNRCFTVQIGHCVSTDIPLGCGVLQGLILGPVLFSMYLLPLASYFFLNMVSPFIYMLMKPSFIFPYSIIISILFNHC